MSKQRKKWTNERVDAILAPLGGTRVGDVFTRGYGNHCNPQSYVRVDWSGCTHGTAEVRCNDLRTGNTTGCRPCKDEARTAATLAGLRERFPEFDLALTDPIVSHINARARQGLMLRAAIEYTCPSCNERRTMQLAHFTKGARCPACAKYGFDPSKPGTLYLLHRIKDGDEQRQYGITNDLTKRMRQHRRHGWVLLDRLDDVDGAAIQALESRIKSAMRREGIYRSVYDGTTGTTEAWSSADLSAFTRVNELLRWMQRVEMRTAI